MCKCHGFIQSANDYLRRCRMLADGFSQYFTDKLDRIRQSITASLQQLTEPDYRGRRHTGPTLSPLLPTTADEVKKVLTTDVCRHLCCVRLSTYLHQSFLALPTCRFHRAGFQQPSRRFDCHAKDAARACNYQTVKSTKVEALCFKHL